jgi:hypothetical protein
MHGADGIVILANDVIESPTAILEIAKQSPDEPDVGLDMEIKLQIKQIPDRLIPKCENALNDENLAGPHRLGFGSAPGTVVIVNRALYPFALV